MQVLLCLGQPLRSLMDIGGGGEEGNFFQENKNFFPFLLSIYIQSLCMHM